MGRQDINLEHIMAGAKYHASEIFIIDRATRATYTEKRRLIKLSINELYL